MGSLCPLFGGPEGGWSAWDQHLVDDVSVAFETFANAAPADHFLS